MGKVDMMLYRVPSFGLPQKQGAVYWRFLARKWAGCLGAPCDFEQSHESVGCSLLGAHKACPPNPHFCQCKSYLGAERMKSAAYRVLSGCEKLQ